MTADQLNELIQKNQEQIAQLREDLAHLENLIVATQLWPERFSGNEEVFADFHHGERARFRYVLTA